MQSGVLAGYPVVDVKVTLYDGSYHEVDSSEMAFKIAGSMAFKDAMRRPIPSFMEPIMKVDVTVPEEYMGDVIGDLNCRRGQHPAPGVSHACRADHDAKVPLSEMFGYATRPAFQDPGPWPVLHGALTHYSEVPKSVCRRASWLSAR